MVGDIVDLVGAGDSFRAGLITYIARNLDEFKTGNMDFTEAIQMGNLFALEENLSLVWAIDGIDAVEDRRLSRPVGTNNGIDDTLLDFKRNPVQCLQATETDGKVLDLKKSHMPPDG